MLRSRREIMEELVKRAKLHKHVRQAQREKDVDAIAELDKGLDSVMALLLQGGEQAERVRKHD